MKLFYQLSEDEQNDALHHCANIVIEDMINDGVKLEPFTEEDEELKIKLEMAVDDAKKLPVGDDKIGYLLSDPDVSKAIYDIALEMAKSAFYHQDQELVIFIDSLSNRNEKENLLPESTTTKPKKTSLLN